MIFFYSITFFFGIFFSIILRLGKPIFFNLSYASLGLLNEVLSPEEDDIKATAIQKQTLLVLKQLFYLVLLILALLMLFYLQMVLFSTLSFLFAIFSDDLFFSWQYWLIFSLGTVIPFLFIRKKELKNTYSETSKLLHRLVLSNYNVSKWLYRKDLKKNHKTPKEEFIIVSGLARSGTTSLMNYLCQYNQFSSLDYSNMPFLMSPNIWRKFYNPKKNKDKERAHSDGIKIGFSSAEALEEYFFKVQLNNNYIQTNAVVKHQISEEIYRDYLNYQSIVRKKEDSIYLSKNNNFLLRYESVREKNKQFTFVVMLREPLAHAHSLLKQHQNFIKQQEADPFVLEYMNWLGHHEFGLNHKPFLFEEKTKYVSDKNSIDYWLQIWLNYHSYLLSLDLNKIILIDYEFYCQSPARHVGYILEQLKIKTENNRFDTFVPTKESDVKCSEGILENAQKIFEQLRKQTLFYRDRFG